MECEYQVYAHSINGQVFYVGQGRGGRPWERIGRNLAWCRMVAANAGQFSIAILAEFPTREEACAREREEIQSRQPAANITRPKNRKIRQTKWQTEKRAKGLCETCGKRKIAKRSKRRCGTCLTRDRDRKREKGIAVTS